ncbi:MAG TPA: hypothetical protein PLU72_17055 [Candidatus Ozemobacteraceae bacterium]|mgnify:FL=1|nr:hypothetical protein [Candidatus Ozemobacteraceae bacterium]HQG27745.1 hypothetical protein [Candidatus Ozemobacteraceae bacterium]
MRMFDRYRKLRGNGAKGGTRNAYLPQAEESFDDFTQLRLGHVVKMFHILRALRSSFVLPSLFTAAFCMFFMSSCFITDGLRHAADTIAYRCATVIELFDRISSGKTPDAFRAAAPPQPSNGATNP